MISAEASSFLIFFLSPPFFPNPHLKSRSSRKIDRERKNSGSVYATLISLHAAHVVIMSIRVCQNIQAACDHALVMRRI